MANGKVCTGFSMPWVALYAASNGTVTYSGGIPLARGVDVSLSVEGSGDNDFYADNVKAESDTQAFTSGTVSLTVDGLKDAARKLISGVTSTKTVTVDSASVSFDVYDDQITVPYVGIGFVARYMENGVTTYCPVILNKCRFNPEGLDAATQEDTISFQTQSLEAEILRDDSANHAWKMIGEDQTTEAAAVAAYKAVLTAGT
jgi:phi13 family phage major tail protein